MSGQSKLAVLLLVAVSSVQASSILVEGFDSVPALPGAGWVMINNSNPIGSTGWFQGNSGVFPAYAGAPDSYVAANFLSAGIGGNISNWLLTPEVPLINGRAFSFYTRTETGSVFPDRLELRLSTNGASTDVGAGDATVGDFTTLLVTVNPTLAVGGYFEDWTQVSTTLSGVSGSGRFGFRYYVPDNLVNANYIGIDSVEYVPEPSTLALAAIGLGLVGVVRLRRRNRRTE